MLDCDLTSQPASELTHWDEHGNGVGHRPQPVRLTGQTWCHHSHHIHEQHARWPVHVMSQTGRLVDGTRTQVRTLDWDGPIGIVDTVALLVNFCFVFCFLHFPSFSQASVCKVLTHVLSATAVNNHHVLDDPTHFVENSPFNGAFGGTVFDDQCGWRPCAANLSHCVVCGRDE